MLQFRRTHLLRPLCGAFLLFAACDEAEDTEDVEFRFEVNQCVGMNSGSQTLTYGNKGHGPLPWDPDGDPFAPLDEAPQEWIEALQKDARGNTISFLVADFERDGRTANCPRTCKEAGMRWEGGGGCVDSGSFTYEGLDYAEPTYEDGPRYQMRVHAEVQMGCVCNELQ